MLLILPNVERLTLQDTVTFWALDAPNLTTLTISTLTRLDVAEQPYNLFPSLLHLTITCYSIDVLLKIRAPVLYSLHLTIWGDRDQIAHEFRTKCVEPNYLSPVHFHLIRTFISYPSLLYLVSGMKYLQSVELENVPLKRPFFEALQPKRKTVNEKNLNTGQWYPKKVMETPYPGIKKLKIDLSRCGASTRVQKTRDLVSKVMKKRAENNVLEKASIRYTTEEGWHDLL